ncbi:MerR family transcriptional regulator [Frateuria sp. Soil773]|uniref:MerR family transcriptional regulator n=1 Tax=Frateuria sp. Soil773 TaxID=1736407 RepID=UPI0006F3F225|nr:helix-turn-helix domain-containing protein [Frateuria sp. Soil773]KRE89477.1 MerR family transcriptional regulator [Frateuria sp. Soil773]
MDHYRIGDLARATDTKVETIRWYEKQGLMPAVSRTAGNYRLYAPAALARLSFIRRARNLGFSLDQVRGLLGLAEQRDADCASVDALAATHLAEIDRKVADLMRLRKELSDLLVSCKGGRIAECRIIDALTPRI